MRQVVILPTNEFIRSGEYPMNAMLCLLDIWMDSIVTNNGVCSWGDMCFLIEEQVRTWLEEDDGWGASDMVGIYTNLVKQAHPYLCNIFLPVNHLFDAGYMVEYELVNGDILIWAT